MALHSGSQLCGFEAGGIGAFLPQKMLPFCSGRVPILVHPSFYRSLKLRYPMDVGGITRDDRVSTELGTGSLRQAVGILNPKDFRPIVASE